METFIYWNLVAMGLTFGWLLILGFAWLTWEMLKS